MEKAPNMIPQSFPFLPVVIRWRDFYHLLPMPVWSRSFTDVLDKYREMEINPYSFKLPRS